MCPHCHKPMVAYELDGVEIDRCLVCGGTWLDAGELEMIADRVGAPSSEFADLLGDRDVKPAASRKCPRCGRRMEEFTTESPVAVTLDRCPIGHGLWFDAGEMKRLIGAPGSAPSTAMSGFFAELYRSEHQSPAKGG